MSATGAEWLVERAVITQSCVSGTLWQEDQETLLIHNQEHITSMPAGENGKAAQYHGPPNQNRDIVSYNLLAPDAALNHRTAFPH